MWWSMVTTTLVLLLPPPRLSVLRSHSHPTAHVYGATLVGFLGLLSWTLGHGAVSPMATEEGAVFAPQGRIEAAVAEAIVAMKFAGMSGAFSIGGVAVLAVLALLWGFGITAVPAGVSDDAAAMRELQVLGALVAAFISAVAWATLHPSSMLSVEVAKCVKARARASAHEGPPRHRYTLHRNLLAERVG